MIDIDYIDVVACGAASHLRLKQQVALPSQEHHLRRMWSGFSSEIETVLAEYR